MASISQSISTSESLQAPEEKGLINRAVRGDASAFESLYARHKRALFQTALRVLGNVEDAEDALQEGLLAAYRNLKRFEGRSQFSTWLTRIVINASLMRRRSMRSRPAVSLENFSDEENTIPAEERFAAADPSPEEIYERRELSNLIKSESCGAFASAARCVCVARKSGAYDIRSGACAGRFGKYFEGAVVARASATGGTACSAASPWTGRCCET